MRNEKPTHINEKYVKECQLKLHKLCVQMEKEGATAGEISTAMSLMVIRINEYIVKEIDKAILVAS